MPTPAEKFHQNTEASESSESSESYSMEGHEPCFSSIADSVTTKWASGAFIGKMLQMLQMLQTEEETHQSTYGKLFDGGGE